MTEVLVGEYDTQTHQKRLYCCRSESRLYYKITKHVLINDTPLEASIMVIKNTFDAYKKWEFMKAADYLRGLLN